MDPKLVVRRLIEEVWKQGRIYVLEQLVDTPYTDHSRTLNQSRGVEGFKQSVVSFRRAFHDLKIAVEALIAEQEIVACRVTLKGTQRGEFMGIAPTGRHVEVTGLGMYRLSSGKIIEHWAGLDEMGMIHQLRGNGDTQR